MKAAPRQDTIHVALAADGNYAMTLAVAIASAARNCSPGRRLRFHVIQSGFGPELREKVEASLERSEYPDASIDWLDAQFGRIQNLKIAHSYITPMTYARLLIPDLLPVNVEKVLYLDSDLVVLDDLGELWDTDVTHKTVFAARDLIGFVSAPAGLANYRELGIPSDAKYFNAGVLLMNLRKWREGHTSDRVFEYLEMHREIIKLNDQEGLNAILFSVWGELDFRWNWQIPWRYHRLGKRKMPWIPETKRKSIVHFTTAEKPWVAGCDYEERKYFFQYLDHTPWAGWHVPYFEEVSQRSRRTLSEMKATARNLLFASPRLLKPY